MNNYVVCIWHLLFVCFVFPVAMYVHNSMRKGKESMSELDCLSGSTCVNMFSSLTSFIKSKERKTCHNLSALPWPPFSDGSSQKNMWLHALFLDLFFSKKGHPQGHLLMQLGSRIAKPFQNVHLMRKPVKWNKDRSPFSWNWAQGLPECSFDENSRHEGEMSQGHGLVLPKLSSRTLLECSIDEQSRLGNETRTRPSKILRIWPRFPRTWPRCSSLQGHPESYKSGALAAC